MSKQTYDNLPTYRKEILDFDHPTSRDMRKKLIKYGSLSVKQWNYASSIKAEGEAKKNMVAIPDSFKSEPRSKIVGIILKIKMVENDFGSVRKMMVQDYRKFQVWGSLTDRIIKEVCPKVGDCIQFTAAVQPKREDPTFGFFKRPNNCSVLKRREDMATKHASWNDDEEVI